MSIKLEYTTPLEARIAFGVIFSLVVGVVLVRAQSWLPEAPDQFVYDWRTLHFSDTAKAPRDDIALVLVNEDSLVGYMTRSPVDRGMLAQLVGEISEVKPKAIGLDFIITYPAAEESTRLLLEAIRKSRDAGVPVVLGALDERSRLLKERDFDFQNKFIRQTATALHPEPTPTGHVYLGNQENHITIADQTVRYMVKASPIPPSRLAFAKVLADLGGSPKALPENLLISWLLPPGEGGLDLFPTLEVPIHKGPEAQVTGPEPLPRDWLAPLAGKLVLIGGDFVDRDLHLTPLSVRDDTHMAGVKIHAQILAQLLDGRVILTLKPLYEILLVAGVTALAFLISQILALEKRELLVTTVAFLLLIGGDILLFWAFKFVLPSATIALAWPVGLIAGNRVDSILGVKPMSWLTRQQSGA
jgi:adenylate cyclase